MRRISLLVILGLAGTALVLPARAEGGCPADKPVAATWPASALFSYSLGLERPTIDGNASVVVGQRAGDAARMSGEIELCRAAVSNTVIDSCKQHGSATAGLIPAQILNLELDGATQAGAPASLHQSVLKPTLGFIGPFSLACDGQDVRFASPAWAGFDTALSFVLSAVQTNLEIELSTRLDCLPGGPEDFAPCDLSEPIWQNAGEKEFVPTPLVPPIVEADSLCILPYFDGPPSERSCGIPMGQSADRRVHSRLVRVAIASVSDVPIREISTTSISYDQSDYASAVQAEPWQDPDGDGVWIASFLVAQPSDAAECPATPVVVHVSPVPIASSWTEGLPFTACPNA